MTVFVKPVGDPYGNIGWAELETITTEGTALSDEGIPQRWDIITAPSSFTRTIEVKFLDFNHNMIALMYGIEEYNQTQQFKAIMRGHRYWHDYIGQPRRNPTMRPLLQNGKKPR